MPKKPQKPKAPLVPIFVAALCCVTCREFWIQKDGAALAGLSDEQVIDRCWPEAVEAGWRVVPDAGGVPVRRRGKCAHLPTPPPTPRTSWRAAS